MFLYCPGNGFTDLYFHFIQCLPFKLQHAFKSNALWRWGSWKFAPQFILSIPSWSCHSRPWGQLFFANAVCYETSESIFGCIFFQNKYIYICFIVEGLCIWFLPQSLQNGETYALRMPFLNVWVANLPLKCFWFIVSFLFLFLLAC